MRAKNRIALYGGTFDPVHAGHLEIARKVATLFEIEKVLFVPAQQAPHKVGRCVTAALHRYAMLALATQNDSSLAISTFELDAPDRRYTVETIRHFQQQLGDTTELFFVMGSDSWSEITTWREWERLLTMTNHIVVTRPGYELLTDHVAAVRERIIDLRTGDTSLTANAKGIFFTDVVTNEVSATNIRQLASEDRIEELAGLVPGTVLDYIRKYEIYRNWNEAKFNS
jgi:nicotinate-nucleotide adenylyltransferase